MCSTSVDAAGAVEGDADGVEADLGVAGRRRGARPSRRWPGGGPARCLRRPTARTGRSGPKAAPLAAGLDLDEDERAAVEGDDVELAVAGAGVALDDLPAGGGEAARRPAPRPRGRFAGACAVIAVDHRAGRAVRAVRAIGVERFRHGSRAHHASIRLA